MNTRNRQKWLSHGTSAIALCVSLLAIWHVTAAETEQRVHDRILAELKAESAPVFEDLDIQWDPSPKTLCDLLHPLIGIEPYLAPGGDDTAG